MRSFTKEIAMSAAWDGYFGEGHSSDSGEGCGCAFGLFMIVCFICTWFIYKGTIFEDQISVENSLSDIGLCEKLSKAELIEIVLRRALEQSKGREGKTIVIRLFTDRFEMIKYVNDEKYSGCILIYTQSGKNKTIEWKQEKGQFRQLYGTVEKLE
jgi:hypothetical protein